MTTQEHVYESAKGTEFLSWHDWANQILSKEELDIYLTEEMSEEKLALYTRWIEEEQINKHTILEDGKEILTRDLQ